MHCPYCGIGISGNSDEWRKENYLVPDDSNEWYQVLSIFCPDCNKFILKLQHGTDCHVNELRELFLRKSKGESLIFPKFPHSKKLVSMFLKGT